MHNTYYLMSDVCYFMNNNEESGYSHQGKKKTTDPCLTPCTKQLQKGWRPGGRTQREDWKHSLQQGTQMTVSKEHLSFRSKYY